MLKIVGRVFSGDLNYGFYISGLVRHQVRKKKIALKQYKDTISVTENQLGICEEVIFLIEENIRQSI